MLFNNTCPLSINLSDQQRKLCSSKKKQLFLFSGGTFCFFTRDRVEVNIATAFSFLNFYLCRGRRPICRGSQMLQFPICYKVLYNRSRFLTKLTFHRQFNFAPTIPFLFVGGKLYIYSDAIFLFFQSKINYIPFIWIFKNRQKLQCNAMHTMHIAQY